MNNTQAGPIIGYLLPGARNPERIWHGRVLRTFPACVLVESTEPGYEGMTEYVMAEFILPMTLIGGPLDTAPPPLL